MRKFQIKIAIFTLFSLDKNTMNLKLIAAQFNQYNIDVLECLTFQRTEKFYFESQNEIIIL